MLGWLIPGTRRAELGRIMSTILRGITWDHPRGLASVRGAAAEWSRLRMGPSVEWEARSLQRFADQPLEDLAEAFDLLVIDHPHIPYAANRGLLQPLDGAGHDQALRVLSGQSVGKSHASYAYRGHQYGLAIDTAAQVAVFRADLLPTPPTTWEEVFELARTGRVLWPAKPVDAVSSFLTLAANLGTTVAARRLIPEDAGLAVLDQLHRLADLIDPACLDENPIETAERLAASDNWCYAPLTFGYINYSRRGFRRHRLTYVDMPAGPGGVSGSCLGGAGIAVSARSPRRHAAVEHAFWLADAQTQRGVYYASGGQPGNVAAWDDAALNSDCLDFFRGTRRTVEQAWLRPSYEGWLDVQDAVGILVNQAFRRQIDDQMCLVKAEQAYAESRRQEGWP